MAELTFKYIYSDLTDVWDGDVYLGYIYQNTSGDNFKFVPCADPLSLRTGAPDPSILDFADVFVCEASSLEEMQNILQRVYYE